MDEVLKLAEDLGAGLIVLGSRGRGPVKRLVMGSVSDGVAHGAPCPVLVMRGGGPAWPPERVVLGYDGSEEAKTAAEMGAAIGGFYGAKVLLVRAYPTLPEIDADADDSTARMPDDGGRFEAQKRELGARAEEIEGPLGSRPRVRVGSGDATVCLLAAAEEEGAPEKSLTAVGSRGLGSVRRATLGSVSTKMLHVARGPVLVCPVEGGRSGVGPRG